MLYRNFASQEEIDREYNVEALVSDFGAVADFFVNQSRAARRDLDCALDVRFGPTRAEHLDIFPAAKPGAPVLVFIHGGYWRMLSAKEFSLVARGPVARGCTVVVTNYALCPDVSIAEITRQSRAAIAWVYGNIARFNGDATRIVAAGHSAGGQQVGRLLQTDWSGDYGLPDDIIKAGLPISGLFDLRPFPYSWLAPKLRLDHHTVMTESPLFDIPAAAPPVVVTVGGDESAEFIRQSQAYLDAMRAAGHPAAWFDQPGRNHFTAIEGFLHADSPLTDRTMDLIAEAAPAAPSRPDAAAQTPAEPERPVANAKADRGEARRYATYGAEPPRLDFERSRR
jgi:arylformamidase